jgi:putative nucleotidyltransferase with HDIG domain
MRVHVVADNSVKLAEVLAIVDRHHAVVAELLSQASGRRDQCQALVARVDLRAVENINLLKNVLSSSKSAEKRIFLLDRAAHLDVAQAYALGATLVLAGPLDPARLLRALADGAAANAASNSRAAEDENAAAAFGAAAIAAMFAAVAKGVAVDVAGTKMAGSRIAQHVAEKGLSDWLATVRSHHEGTYQHCLLVTGVAVDFGLSLGMPSRDIERLYTAAMFHDIGKAMIPVSVLDKPGRLDADERRLIETHPVVGYDTLKDSEGISAEVLDAVRHHHEYLDGSGYPDALSGERISDIVRILTISDVFSALIEDRRYKPPMPRQDAYGILSGMQGKLEKPLVGSFRDVALRR